MEQTRILIVEDERIVGKDIEERLCGLKYKVVDMVSTGEKALERVEYMRPDLVLMDVRLRGNMDGIETAERIRKNFDIPVIYLTAYADPLTLERAKETGPFGYILKPFNDHDLYTTIEMALYKHKTERKLRESEERLTTTLQSLGDAVITTDVEGRITFMNRVAEKLLGWKFADVMYKMLDDVCFLPADETMPSFQNLAKNVVREGQGTIFGDHMLLILHDERKIPVDIRISPIKDEERRINGVVLVFRDISDRKYLENQLKHSQEMKMLGQVAAGVAHEVRNPLNAILAITEALFQDIGSNAEYLPYLEHIRSQVNRLSGLMKDLLDLGKPVQAFQLRSESLLLIISSTSDLWNQAALSKTHPVLMELPDGLDTFWVLTESNRVQQVLLNLLENAAQNSPEGECLVLTILAPVDGMVRIRITDKGAGIPAENLEKIFQPFFTTRRGGVGLGLSIVKHLIESMGGTVAAWNNIGSSGCTVEVALPLAEWSGS